VVHLKKQICSGEYTRVENPFHMNRSTIRNVQSDF